MRGSGIAIARLRILTSMKCDVDRTGWTGVVAKLIQLFGLLDAKKVLEAGKAAAFVRGT